MSGRQGVTSKASIVISAVVILLFLYASILTLHYKIPGKIIARINHTGTAADLPWPNIHENEVLFHEIHKKADVIMLGDSITYGAQWNEYYPGITIFNRGVGGDTTAGVMARLDPIISEKPDRIFLMIGINDILAGKSSDHVANNITSIARKIKNSGIRPYIESILYTEQSYRYLAPTSREINSSVRAVNDKVRAQCQRDGIDYVDINTALSDEDGFLKQGHSYDGVHPNAKGYAIWVEALRKQIVMPR